ncbi:MAG: DUF5989 family protein [Planctomycetaceae bacterium]
MNHEPPMEIARPTEVTDAAPPDEVAGPPGIVREFVTFLWLEKRWWLLPLLLIVAALLLLAWLTRTPARPLTYPQL